MTTVTYQCEAHCDTFDNQVLDPQDILGGAIGETDTEWSAANRGKKDASELTRVLHLNLRSGEAIRNSQKLCDQQLGRASASRNTPKNIAHRSCMARTCEQFRHLSISLDHMILVIINWALRPREAKCSPYSSVITSMKAPAGARRTISSRGRP